MFEASLQSPLIVSDFHNDIFGPYDDEIFLFFPLVFVCATSGTNVNDIRRIDFRNFRYPWDEPDESNKTTWRWTQRSLHRRLFCQYRRNPNCCIFDLLVVSMRLRGNDRSPTRSCTLPDGVHQFPYSGEMMIVVFGGKIQMVHESHWRLQTRVRNGSSK